MTDAEARLLAEIRERPDDDAPRAVYADLLMRRGDERGEYVALGLGHARDELSAEQRARYLELDRRDTQWAKELGCEGVQVVRWRRGFPEVLCVHTSDVARVPGLLRLPFRGLVLRHAGGEREAAELAQIPELAVVEDLGLLGPLVNDGRAWVWSEFPPDELATIVGSPHWTALRRIGLEQGALTDRGAAILGRAPWLAQLERIEAVQAALTGDGLAHLLARSLPRLQELRIWHAPLGDAGARAVDACDLPALEKLTLGVAGLTPAGGRVVFGSRNLARVTLLDLRENDLGGSLAALAESPHTPALAELVLDSTRLDSDDATALAAATLPALATLRLPSNVIGDAGAAALAASRGLPRLATLDLDHNVLTRDGVMPFTRTTLPALATLRIAANPLPSGVLRDETYYDQGFEVGGGTVDVPFTTDELRTWFAAAGSAIKIC